jgi:hypothetical protein
MTLDDLLWIRERIILQRKNEAAAIKAAQRS